MNDEVNMRHYGGLRKYLPVTFITFGLGYLAIIGFPGLSGFFSKDKIIEAAFAQGGTEGWILGVVTLVGAAVTAFYMTRVMLMTFFGKQRWQPDDHGELPHPHESPKIMTLPMIVLAVGSVLAGGLFSINDAFVNWLTPVTGYSEGNSPLSSTTVTLITAACMVAGVGVSYLVYGRSPVPVAPPVGSVLTRAARRDLLQDDINHALLVRPGSALTAALVYFDAKGLDGVVNGVSATIGGLSSRVRRVQNGYVRSYALSMFGGTLVLVATTLLMRSV
jgi:NADH-quinone oxidoreductase subunit L